LPIAMVGRRTTPAVDAIIAVNGYQAAHAAGKRADDENAYSNVGTRPSLFPN